MLKRSSPLPPPPPRARPTLTLALAHALPLRTQALFDIARAHEKQSDAERRAARLAKADPAAAAAAAAPAVDIPKSSTVKSKIFDELHSQVDAMLHRSSYHWVDASLWTSAFGVAAK